jgi:hypothetical protein
MERRFDMSDFEQSLKDHADQFRLIPSKRVWNGIYNNLHPGSKWPSITVAIIFLITLVTIGNLNNSQKNPENKKITAFNSNSKTTNNVNSISESKAVNGRNEQEANSLLTKLNKNQNRLDKNIPEFNSVDKPSSIKERSATENISLNKKNTAKNTNQLFAKNNLSTKNLIINHQENKEKFSNGNTENISEIKIITPVFSVDESENLHSIENEFAVTESINSLKNDLIIPVSDEMVSFRPAYFSASNSRNALSVQSENLTSGLSQSNSTVNKKPSGKKNKSVEWTFYVTPLISSVSFDKKTIQPSISSQRTSSIVMLQNQSPASFKLIHSSRLGFETGVEMAYKFSKKFGLITGANISYSSYNNISNFIHPTYANLILTDKSGAYQRNYLTHYGNGQSSSQISLTNYNLEISVPIGLQYKIWKNEKIQIDVSSVIEPSTVLKGDAFIISSDGRYYVNDPSLIRKFNVGAAFGSYITFSAKKVKWHIGPDFRYQLLSTYKNIYPSKEHFIDYGIRIGISK